MGKTTSDAYTSTLSRKGQVVIPADLRRRLGLDEGDKVVMTEDDGVIRVQRMDAQFFKQFAGIIAPGATKALLAERRRDREKEDESE